MSSLRGEKRLQPSCNLESKLDRSAADRLVAAIDSACGHQPFDVAKVEAEAKVKPHGLADNRRREAMALKRMASRIAISGQTAKAVVKETLAGVRLTAADNGVHLAD